jgi:hypothetical protein
VRVTDLMEFAKRERPSAIYTPTAGAPGAGAAADVEGQGPPLLSRRQSSAAVAERAAEPEEDPVGRLHATMQAFMRYAGLPKEVGLRLLDRVVDGTADGSYARGRIAGKVARHRRVDGKEFRS